MLHGSHLFSQGSNARDHAPNKYTVILKFNTSKEAQDFEQKYNGKQFNVSEVCIFMHIHDDDDDSPPHVI